MISRQTLSICPEGKPVSTLGYSPRACFRIMLGFMASAPCVDGTLSSDIIRMRLRADQFRFRFVD